MVNISILGAGPHGQQILRLHPDWVLFDDNLRGYKRCRDAPNEAQYVIGAAFPQVRRTINEKYGSPGGAWRGHGNIIFPYVFLGHDVQLGEHVHILPGAVVSHGCQVGDFVTIASHATLCGEVTVESGAFIGAGAAIRHGGITIGRNAIVGMGAVVVDDVPEGAKVFGNPAKIRVPA